MFTCGINKVFKSAGRYDILEKNTRGDGLMKAYRIIAAVMTALSIISLSACGNVAESTGTGNNSRTETSRGSVAVSESSVEIQASIDEPAVKKILNGELQNKEYTVQITTILQNPELPTGCESVSLAMAFNAIGFPTEKTELADNFMPYGRSFVTTFLGDPHKRNGMGIYPPGLVTTAQNYIQGKSIEAVPVDLTGLEFSELYKLIENGYPIVIWTTGGLNTPIAATGEDSYEIVNGRKYTWYNNIHCVVLSGFDTEKKTVTVNDPLSSKPKIYDAEQFENVYNGLDRMAMTVIKK